jgi:hypothetical protein
MPLFPHQEQSVQDMETIECIRRRVKGHVSVSLSVSIFADLPGSGKTRSMATLLARDRMPWNDGVDVDYESISAVYGHGMIIKKQVMRYRRLRATLVLAGNEVLEHWVMELSEVWVSGSVRVRTVVTQSDITDMDPDDYDVVLVTTACFNQLIDRFAHCMWKRFVYDEPLYARVVSMRRVISGFTWFITSSPHELLGYNFSRAHYLSEVLPHDYHLWDMLIMRNDDSFIRSSHVLPLLEHSTYMCSQPRYTLRDCLAPSTLSDMVSKGNIEDAIRALGGFVDCDGTEVVSQSIRDKIVECDFHIHCKHDDETGAWTRKRSILLAEAEGMLHRRDITRVSYSCTICLESLLRPVTVLCCNHLFCGSCILRWLHARANCPLCRREISSDLLFYQTSSSPKHGRCDSPDTSLRVISPTKENQIIEILVRNYEHGRFLLFSSTESSYTHLKDRLTRLGVSFGLPQGTPVQRSKTLDSFSRGDIKILLLTTSRHLNGIRLPGATDIILYHSMNPSMESQVVSRAYRIGRTSTLRVHHLL